MTRNEDRREHGNLAQGRIDSKADAQIGRAKLRETICLRPPDNLVDVRQRRQRRDEVVLHIAEVEQEVAAGKHRVFVRGLATLHEAVQHIDLAVETPHDMGDPLAEDIDPRDELLDVVDAGNEDLVFDCFGLSLGGAGERLEAVDDVISASR